jgi:hypothetical protein
MYSLYGPYAFLKGGRRVSLSVADTRSYTRPLEPLFLLSELSASGSSPLASLRPCQGGGVREVEIPVCRIRLKARGGRELSSIVSVGVGLVQLKICFANFVGATVWALTPEPGGLLSRD